MKKILIVDDAAFVRKKIRLLVEQNDFEVVGEAENGIEALNMYKLYKPDIVTMDITMPLMDGIEALKSILNFDPKAKVVVVSALGQEAQVKRAVLSGAKSFIVKPLNDEYVINALRKVAAM
ncbi:response regulator [Inconstantimicrobium mannanitabidum]|uniref:Response regulator n=1 Tax=Inconstantimicrobium mannanitabidum TaxID=1604901 RepID=A0ACB5RHI3_9CLOT|nr:response regulator [Clostridium sp. TW13]GKX68564.1 response regulator [Clostridium sp. TW13]